MLRSGDGPPDSGSDGASDLAVDPPDATSDRIAVDRATARDPTALCPPPETPSRQTVTFQLVNHATSDRYVVTSGQRCDAFSLDGFSLAVGFQCGCECPRPAGPCAATLQRLGPGASMSLTWDARVLSTCSRDLSCLPGEAMILVGALKSAPPGAYRARFALEDAPPAGCSSEGDRVSCGPSDSDLRPPGIQTICPATSTVSVDFTLPESGDVTVAVPL